MYPFDVSDFVGFGPRLRFRDITRAYPRVTVPATDLPVDIDQVKLHARISGDDENPLIMDYIRMAVEAVEYDAEIALMPQTRVLTMDFFPAWEMELRCLPVTAVSSVTYLDYAGVTQTHTAYRTDLNSRPAIITPSYGTVWPVAYPVIGSVNVTFTCGYASAAEVPLNAKLAIYLKVADMYWNREFGETNDERYQSLVDKLRWRKVA